MWSSCLLVIALLAFDGPGVPSSYKTQDASQLPGTMAVFLGQDSTSALERFLLRHGYGPFEVVAESGALIAVDARSTSDSLRYLLSVYQDADSFLFMRDPEQVAQWAEFETIEWVSLSGSTIDVLRVTYDVPIEGPLATHLYRVEGRVLVDLFHDSRTVCDPADLRDLDRDGRLELIQYQEYTRVPGYCHNACYLQIDNRFGMSVSWPVVKRWSGHVWVDVSLEFTEFYRALAARYRDIAAWLSQPDVATMCAQDSEWLVGGGVFNDWAIRARIIGERRE